MEEQENRRADICIDHPVLKLAKEAFNECLKMAIARAVDTGSMEGCATLKVAFEIDMAEDENGEVFKAPGFAYKAGYSVPMKNSIDGKIIETSRLYERKDGYGFMLVNDQVTMDELLEDGTV